MTALANHPDYIAYHEERLQNPYPLFDRMRAEDPVHWCEPMKLWLLTKYDDVYPLLRDSRLSSSRMQMYHQQLPEDLKNKVQPLLDHLKLWIIMLDPPDHGRLRKLVNLAFTPRMLELLRPRIQSLTDDFLANVKSDEPFDLVEVFSRPYPATVICEMLGIPIEQREIFRQATEKLMWFSTRGGPKLQESAIEANAAVIELRELFEPLIHARRRQPGADLISALTQAAEEGDKLNNDELFAMCVFLFLAGHETTTSTIASGLMLLLTHPAEYQKLKADLDGVLPDAIEEILRFESAVPRAVRQAKDDMEIRNRRIKAGQTVVLLLGAANRDPDQFPNPNQFDVTRNPNKHVSFGFGPHFCLGAQLARIELDIAFRAIARKLPDLQLHGDDLRWQPVMGVRGLKKLLVTNTVQ